MTDQTLGSDLPSEDATSESAIDRLLHQAHYTPKQLAELLDVPLTLVEQDAFAGRLKATIVEHDILSISRDDAIAWLRERE